MSLTIATACNAAALDGITSTLNGGEFVLRASSSALANLPLQTSGGAFQAASVASPSIAQSNAIGSDTSPVAGTIDNFILQNAAAASRIAGTVGTSGADLVVTDNVIPGSATEVSCSAGLQLSLTLA